MGTNGVTLEALGLDTEDLRGEVVDAAANKLLGRYTDDDAPIGESKLAGELREMFKEQLREAVAPRVAEVLEEAFEGSFTPTDKYGSPRHGVEPMTLREYILGVVQEHIKLGENREGYSYGHDKGNTISRWLNEEVAKHVRSELWSNYKAIADAVVERACSTIRQMTDDELARAAKKR
jgi:hypothetical protein